MGIKNYIKYRIILFAVITFSLIFFIRIGLILHYKIRAESILVKAEGLREDEYKLVKVYLINSGDSEVKVPFVESKNDKYIEGYYSLNIKYELINNSW